MNNISADKISSVTKNVDLRRDLRLTHEIDCQEGSLIAVRVQSRKSQYNTLELTTGRFALINPGDIMVGALGFRNALLGYEGVIPEQLAPGENVQLLNLGGVLGHCTSWSPSVGEPFQCEVLGQVLTFPELGSRKGKPANIKDGQKPISGQIGKLRTPVVGVVGTCMNSGKTEACLSLIQQFVRKGKRVVAGKTTGVSLRRDIHAMEDVGAQTVRIFTDYGIVTTSKSNAAELACTMLTDLDQEGADVIVLELGDGLMGAYGVDAILAHSGLAQQLSTLVLAANDPVGAWGGVRMLSERFGLEPVAITGPATDNQAGTRSLSQFFSIPALNARTQPEALAACLSEKINAK